MKFSEWKSKHLALWQFVMFILMSGITTIVDFSSFALFNYSLCGGLPTPHST